MLWVFSEWTHGEVSLLGPRTYFSGPPSTGRHVLCGFAPSNSMCRAVCIYTCDRFRKGTTIHATYHGRILGRKCFVVGPRIAYPTIRTWLVHSCIGSGFSQVQNQRRKPTSKPRRQSSSKFGV